MMENKTAESGIINRILQGKFVLIAEIGVNYYDIAAKEHISSMDAAKKMIKAAAEEGIHAVKFQSYKAETLAAKQSPAYWDRTKEHSATQYELFRKYDAFGYEEYRELSGYCQECGIEFLSTAFDTDAADYLDGLMGVYKISSSDLNNLPFIAYQAKKQKPVILSAGASDAQEIGQAAACIRTYNDKPLVLMHCVLEYPAPYAHANLNKIQALKKRYPDFYIGYSDHTVSDACADVIKTAYLLGAQVIEKHFTLDKQLPGNDHYHAMDPQDARKILDGIAFIDQLRGSEEIVCLPGEEAARKNARRSCVSAAFIKAGTPVTQELLLCKRPGTGIAPNDIEQLTGKRAKIDIQPDTVLQWDMFE